MRASSLLRGKNFLSLFESSRVPQDFLIKMLLMKFLVKGEINETEMNQRVARFT